ncbi:UPF0502 protein Vapar_4077 [Burkholderiales bacterium GJ-E10]|nr:UPF0502 protein Vapar_4077 [Burkholderiales bacterium GJ-E10]
MAQMPLLSLLETRVLGVLVEKEHTVPDTYPLSLNALTAGCNQKNNRDPVIEAHEAEVQAAIDSLRAHTLVIESSGARVTRYSHNVGRVLGIPSQSVALMAALMLRGPQTPAELRTATERMHRFADVSSVEAFLTELSERGEDAGGPLVARLARAAGEREARWAHLLSGPVASGKGDAPAVGGAADIPLSELEALRANQVRLTAEVADLRGKLERLAAELGVALSPTVGPEA